MSNEENPERGPEYWDAQERQERLDDAASRYMAGQAHRIVGGVSDKAQFSYAAAYALENERARRITLDEAEREERDARITRAAQ